MNVAAAGLLGPWLPLSFPLLLGRHPRQDLEHLIEMAFVVRVGLVGTHLEPSRRHPHWLEAKHGRVTKVAISCQALTCFFS